MAKYIKFLFVALFATMTISLTSCSDDKDEPPVGNIIGTWRNVSSGIIQYVQFRSDGTSNEVNIDEEDDDFWVLNCTWELNGNSLTVTNHDEEWGIDVPVVSTIEKLTDSELVIETLGIMQTFRKVSDSEIDEYL